MERGIFVKNQRVARIVSLLLVLLLLTGCSAPSEPAATEPEAPENTFTATETSEEDQTATARSASATDAEEASPIALTEAALAENEWISALLPDGQIGLPSNEAFLEALQFDAWEPIEDPNESVEVFRFAVGTGEIVINEGTAYLLTDHGMDWYLIPEDVLENLMMYFEMNYTQSARSMLMNDEFMFTEYYYDTIASLGNLEEFDGHGPLNYEMVKYVWYRYCYENPEETVKALYDEDFGGYIVSEEMAIREARRYFDFDEAATDITKVENYNAEIQGFDFWYCGPEERNGFENAWGIEYGGLKDLGDERYEIRLISYADSDHTRVDRVNVYEFSFDGEGNIRFDRGYQKKPSYKLADAAPDFEPLAIEREYDYMGGRLVGESQMAYYFVDDSEEWTVYNRLNKQTMKMESIPMEELGDGEYWYRVEERGDEFFFYTNKRVNIFDGEWNLIESVAYPDTLANALQDHWENYFDANYFGESMSSDRSMFAYVDAEGLKLYTVATGELELIKPREGDGDVTEAIWCLNPRFVNDDTMILTARTRDYDSGFYLYDLKTKEEKTVEGYIVWEPWQISDGRGFFISDKVNVYYYDFATGEIKDLPVENRGPDVSRSNHVVCNGKYAAYFDQGEEGEDLIVLNLDTWKVEKRASIENMEANILFLGENGDAAIRYFFTYDNFGDAILKNK